MNEEKGLYDELREAVSGEEKCIISLAEFVRPFVRRGEQVTVSGRGTSMLPTIRESDSLVMVPLTEKIKAGDVLLYTRPDGHSIIHRVWRKRKDKLDMLGDHQLYVEKNVPVTAFIARAQTIIHADGSASEAHKSWGWTRVHYGVRWGRVILRAVIKRLHIKNKRQI